MCTALNQPPAARRRFEHAPVVRLAEARDTPLRRRRCASLPGSRRTCRRSRAASVSRTNAQVTSVMTSSPRTHRVGIARDVLARHAVRKLACDGERREHGREHRNAAPTCCTSSREMLELAAERAARDVDALERVPVGEACDRGLRRLSPRRRARCRCSRRRSPSPRRSRARSASTSRSRGRSARRTRRSRPRGAAGRGRSPGDASRRSTADDRAPRRAARRALDRSCQDDAGSRPELACNASTAST